MNKFEIIRVCILCVALLMSLINTILILTKKVKVSDSALSALLLRLPGLIVDAEKQALSGIDKYKYVFTQAIAFMATLTGKTTSDIALNYSNVIDQAIENILETPTKKGDYGDVSKKDE